MIHRHAVAKLQPSLTQGKTDNDSLPGLRHAHRSMMKISSSRPDSDAHSDSWSELDADEPLTTSAQVRLYRKEQNVSLALLRNTKEQTWDLEDVA